MYAAIVAEMIVHTIKGSIIYFILLHWVSMSKRCQDQKPQLQKDREDEKAEGYVPDEGTRKNPRKTTK